MLRMEEMSHILSTLRYKYITHTFSAGGAENNIAHGLKRTPKRWAVVGLSANAVVYGAVDDVYLNLTASAPCTVTLEVA